MSGLGPRHRKVHVEALIKQYPWGFVTVMVLAIVALGWFITHPDGFQKKDKK